MPITNPDWNALGKPEVYYNTKALLGELESLVRKLPGPTARPHTRPERTRARNRSAARR